MKIRKEVKIGAIMIIAIALLFWGANYLKGINLLEKNKRFFAIYERVDGLGSSNPVVINGYKVGQVEEISFLPDNSGRLLVKFSVTEENFRISKDTKAKIISSDILGSKSIELQLGRSNEELQNLDTLESDVEASLTEAVNEQIAPLKRKAEDLISTVDSAIITVSAIFNKKARSDLDASFTSIKNSLETFERTMNQVDGMVKDERNKISEVLTHLESITRNLANNNDKLTASLENIEAISDSLAGANLKQTVNNASIAMTEVASVMQKINQGEGSLGQLINNDTLYNNLERSADDLDKLLLDMRLNPERYVHFSIFGRKKKEAKKEEEN
ncbi:MAG: ABC transporter permease [Flavobacteriales bacterium]|nr:ABC transporter permease [Flavobacteriales bacterium]|tara:strand:+ start:41885 stop:42874 length:990 start_codon:yes stop_codon:yes gene_type:complete